MFSTRGRVGEKGGVKKDCLPDWVKILSSENEHNNITLYSCCTFIITMYSGKAA